MIFRDSLYCATCKNDSFASPFRPRKGILSNKLHFISQHLHHRINHFSISTELARVLSYGELPKKYFSIIFYFVFYCSTHRFVVFSRSLNDFATILCHISMSIWQHTRLYLIFNDVFSFSSCRLVFKIIIYFDRVVFEH